MTRPDFISDKDISRWSDTLDADSTIPKELGQLVKSPIIREVCYAGLWLVEQLTSLQCPESIIVRIQVTGGMLSFGRDPWEVHMDLLKKYRNHELDFENEISKEMN